MANSQRRTDTVGTYFTPERIIYARSIANGRYQVRKIDGIWCMIYPSGRIGFASIQWDWINEMAQLLAKERPDLVRPF